MNKPCKHATLGPCLICQNEDLLAHIRALTAQLPAGMEHCTILFRECEKGHGWLTATNWVQHPCPTCRAEKAEAYIAEVEPMLHQGGARIAALEADLAAAREALAWYVRTAPRCNCASADCPTCLFGSLLPLPAASPAECADAEVPHV